MATKRFRMAIIQMAVSANKAENVKRAVNFVKLAKENGASVVALPECFNSLYGTKYFLEYAEPVSSGETCQALSKAAKENSVYLIGGSMPEKDGNKFYNTCTVWSPDGMLIGKHRKVHLFDIDVRGGIKFKESEVLTPGEKFTTFNTDICKIGIGICYDLRFAEMARIYKNQGCDVLVYPGAFNMTTGPLHWELLQRCRAIDNQVFVAGVAPAHDKTAEYVSWGHSSVIDPWGNFISKTEFSEDVIYADIDLKVVEDISCQIPIMSQRRTDLYETVYKLS